MELRATPSLAAWVAAEVRARGITFEDVRALGGPSAPTMTAIRRADGGRLHTSTAKKLEKAFGWAAGDAMAHADGPPPVEVNLRAERQAKGISVEELARIAGVGPEAIRSWESGGWVPPHRIEQLRAAIEDSGRESSPGLAQASDVALLRELLRRAELRNGC